MLNQVIQEKDHSKHATNKISIEKKTKELKSAQTIEFFYEQSYFECLHAILITI